MSKSPLELKASLRISRPQGSGPDFKPHISIQVIDRDSGVKFLELRPRLSKFAEALTGLQVDDVKATVRGRDLLGLKREFKEVQILLPKQYASGRISEEDAKKIAEPYLVAGWQLNRGAADDFNNHHRRGYSQTDGESKTWVTVGLQRWIDPKEPEAQDQERAAQNMIAMINDLAASVDMTSIGGRIKVDVEESLDRQTDYIRVRLGNIEVPLYASEVAHLMTQLIPALRDVTVRAKQRKQLESPNPTVVQSRQQQEEHPILIA